MSEFLTVLSLNSAHLKQLIRSGDVERLENLVYEGQGRKLLTESSPDPKVKNFLKNLPVLMASKHYLLSLSLFFYSPPIQSIYRFI